MEIWAAEHSFSRWQKYGTAPPIPVRLIPAAPIRGRAAYPYIRVFLFFWFIHYLDRSWRGESVPRPHHPKPRCIDMSTAN